ncbi:MAG: NAD(P)-dependent oxidoreductase [Planctomycetota bacterium]
MQSNKILITGGYGCIGRETVRWLLANTSDEIVICSRRVDEQRTERLFSDVDIGRLTFVEVDVTDFSSLRESIGQSGVTHVVHLAALQTPDCNAHRDLGLQINLAGTQHLVEAIKSNGDQVRRLIFASSIAVYGPRSHHPAGRVPMLAEPYPVNVYGAWKLAGESVSRFFCEDTGIPTLSLRPGVLFGPGRDAGLTSSPTTAMKCVALGIPYEIPFRTRQDYQFAPDVGAAFGQSLLGPWEGYGMFTLPGNTYEAVQIVEAIESASRDLGIRDRFNISVGEDSVPFICDLEYQPFCEAFPGATTTPLQDAVRQSLETFVAEVSRGWLTPDDVRGL